MNDGVTPFDTQSVIKLVLTYPIVWGYQQAAAPYLDGLVRLGVVLLLAVLTWVLLNRTLFPAVTKVRSAGET